MFCSEHFTGKLDFFTSHFHYNLYLKWIISIISYILSLWNLFETKIVANGALDLFKNLLYSSPENKFSITGELTAPGVKYLFILYYKIFGIFWFTFKSSSYCCFLLGLCCIVIDRLVALCQGCETDFLGTFRNNEVD